MSDGDMGKTRRENSHSKIEGVAGDWGSMTAGTDKLLIEVARERKLNMDLDCLPKAIGCVDFGDEEVRPPPPDVQFRMADFKDPVRTGEELVARLGRKWRVSLSNLGKFYMLYGAVLDGQLEDGEEDPCAPILPIPCTGKRLVSVFGSAQKVNRLLMLCGKVGFLARLPGAYRFGSRDKKYNYSYYYAYNRMVAHIIRYECFARRIKIELPSQEMDRAPAEVESDYYRYISGEIDESERVTEWDLPPRLAKVADRITLRTRRIGVKEVSDKEAEDVVFRRYSDLILPRQMLIYEMNKDCLPPAEQIKFKQKVHRDARGYIISIGLRATSSIVSLKAHGLENPNYIGMLRKEYLDNLYGEGGYFEYDVRASIYQIAHLLNFGNWNGNSRDPYEIMFGKAFANSDERDAYKSICMALYFDSPTLILNHNRRRIPKCYRRYGKEMLNRMFAEAMERMEAFTGEKFYNEIFLHESLLYVDFTYWLRKEKGVLLTQIYDGFYIQNGDISEQELDEGLARCAVRYRYDYERWRKRLLAAGGQE